MPTATPSGYQVLFVEDDPPVRDSLTQTLELAWSADVVLTTFAVLTQCWGARNTHGSDQLLQVCCCCCCFCCVCVVQRVCGGMLRTLFL